MTSLQIAPTLGEVARLVRSKNAGPFWITIDVFWDTDSDFRLYHQQISAPQIASVYGVDPSTVKVFALPRLRVTKVSFPRPVSQGGPQERDMHAGQQYVPLLTLPLFATPLEATSEMATGGEVRDTIPL